MVSEKLRQQAQETLDQHNGNQTHAAQALGISRSTLQNRLKGGQGHFEKVPEGYEVKRISTYVDSDGEISGQWTVASEDRHRQAQALTQALEAAKEGIPRAKPQKPPQQTTESLCACYVLADAHIGMLAWGEETRGEDWDSDIAEQTIMAWIDEAIRSAPKAHTGILAQLGDLLHHDGLESITPTSHNVLDADTRFQRLVRIGVRVMRYCIRQMLKRHQQVHVVLAEGNHDQASSVWLREVFSALYEDEPRVTVDTSPDPYYCVEWGHTMIGFHHGHKRKPRELSKILAGKFPETFGRTKYRYGHTGHLHSRDLVEDQLMVVEQHPNLPDNDAYASRLGYSSQCGAHVITYHTDYGEVGRSTIRPEMVA